MPSGSKVVFTNGCFDLLHAGHVRLLEAARAQGDLLVVGLNSDASVKRLKGPSRPVVPEAERAEALLALEAVDHVLVYGEDTPREAIAALLPDVLVKGADWAEDADRGPGRSRSRRGSRGASGPRGRPFHLGPPRPDPPPLTAGTLRPVGWLDPLRDSPLLAEARVRLQAGRLEVHGALGPAGLLLPLLAERGAPARRRPPRARRRARGR